MSLASVGIVTASLFIFGIFLVLIINLNHNTNIIRQQPEMQVFCNYEMDDTQIMQIQKDIMKNPNITDCKLVTAKDAFDSFKKSLGEDASVLEGFDQSLMSSSFIIKLLDPTQSDETTKELKEITGIRKISYSKDIVEFISKLTKWVNLISIILIIILLAISVFIISNTIKLTVFARRKEINIMKFIGATDSFIRWPFVIEGVFIGLIGALLALFLTRMGYGAIESRFNSDLMTVRMDFISLVKTGQVVLRLLTTYTFIGVAVGIAGSIISIRKYLKV